MTRFSLTDIGRSILITLACSLSAASYAQDTSAIQSETLAVVHERGTLRCGVNPSQTGMARQNARGVWEGMGIDLCRAIAAATLGDPNAIEFVPVTARTRFTALQSGEIDVLSRTTTWTFSRDTTQGVDFIGPYFIEVESLLVRASTGFTTVAELDGQPICAVTGSLTETVLRNYQAQLGIEIEFVPVTGTEDYARAYESGRCIGVTDGKAGLESLRAAQIDPDSHRILDEQLALSPLSLAVRHGDDRWDDIVQWTFNALATAELLNVTQTNAQRLSVESRHPIIRRMISPEGGSGALLGLEANWALRAIQAVGNLGEIYERSFGPESALPIERGRSALWQNGGMIFSAPFE
jgi:general L-amino acid transport system substrate-binding protein